MGHLWVTPQGPQPKSSIPAGTGGGGAVDPHPEGSLVPRLLPFSGRAVRVTPEPGSLWPVLFLVLPEYTQEGGEARQPASRVGREEGGQRAEPERGKGCGPFSQVLWTLVPPWFSDAVSMIDPKLFQEVCGVSPLLPPLTPFGPSLASGRSLPWGSFLP